jgi:predicted AAA+ superfamily ATPase
MSLIVRSYYQNMLERMFQTHPIVALIGPRQCGKTTLARMYAATQLVAVRHFDLEDPDDMRALDQPKLLFESLQGLVIIDEIQRKAELFPYLRVLADTRPDLRLLILGSVSPSLIRQSSESLAGRVGYIEVRPFGMNEIEDVHRLWLRGGFPKSYLATNDEQSSDWRKEYVRTFLEKDIPSFGFSLNPNLLRRFWVMLCDYHGALLNMSELGRSLSIDHKTVARYSDILASSFMIRQLQPWLANISKRQVKSYKMYLRDSGLLHYLLQIKTMEQLQHASKLGASWEGFAIETLIQHHKVDAADCFFWATQSGAEIDLLIANGPKLQAFECKYSSAPVMTKSLHSALQTLELECITVIIPGQTAPYKIHDQVTVCGLMHYVSSVCIS